MMPIVKNIVYLGFTDAMNRETKKKQAKK